jgi:hypothetical protein
MERFDAFMILLVISFAQSFIFPDGFMQSTLMAEDPRWICLILVSILVVATFCNWVTLGQLNMIAPAIRQNSYQEVAYMISKGNRGYIFLISAQKTILLCMAAAFSIDYIACVASYLITDKIDPSSEKHGTQYLVYLGFVCVIAMALYGVYDRCNKDRKSADLFSYGKAFVYIALFQWAIIIVMSIVALATPS